MFRADKEILPTFRVIEQTSRQNLKLSDSIASRIRTIFRVSGLLELNLICGRVLEEFFGSDILTLQLQFLPTELDGEIWHTILIEPVEVLDDTFLLKLYQPLLEKVFRQLPFDINNRSMPFLDRGEDIGRIRIKDFLSLLSQRLTKRVT